LFRKSLLWILLFVLVFPVPNVAAAPAPDEEWELIAPGIEYRKFQLPDPNNAFVVRMERSNPNVTLESTIAQGKIAEGRETVSSMASRYDQALSYWGGSANPPNWGLRNQVVVAINGSYFDWNSGIPQGGQVHSGWYSKRYDNMGGWSGFAWKLDRSAFIGECIYHQPKIQFITYYNTGSTQPITRINDTRAWDELVLFTPQWNSRTGTDNSGVEVIVEMERPTMILPYPAFARGFVRQIRNNQGNSLIPFNSIVLSAHGSAAEILLDNVEVGSEIHVSQEITSYEADCSTTLPLSWTKTFASVQGAFFFLKNGQIRDFDDSGATERHPRTAIAYNDQYIFFLVVDGRDPQHSLGMTINELAHFTRDTLGATWGVAQDGGGSSTMVIHGQVINNTYCNIYSCMGKYKYFLPMVRRDNQTGQSVPPEERDIISSAAGIERAVANGMLMVIVQPAAYSPVFSTGDSVSTTREAELRLGPGTNYASFTSIPAGTQGIIADQMNGLDGVQAKSTYWWYVSFGGVTGWVPEGALAHKAISVDLLDDYQADGQCTGRACIK
jgi:hypothetical protein